MEIDMKTESCDDDCQQKVKRVRYSKGSKCEQMEVLDKLKKYLGLTENYDAENSCGTRYQHLFKTDGLPVIDTDLKQGEPIIEKVSSYTDSYDLGLVAMSYQYIQCSDVLKDKNFARIFDDYISYRQSEDGKIHDADHEEFIEEVD